MKKVLHTHLLLGLTFFILFFLIFSLVHRITSHNTSHNDFLFRDTSATNENSHQQLCRQHLVPIDPHNIAWHVNTSNPSKREDFEHLFSRHGLTLAGMTSIDLPEIESTAIDVVIHKASQLEGEGVIVEDSSLDVEGAQVGINIKWLIDRLPEFIGRQAKLTALLAYRYGDYVYVYKGEVDGALVAPRGVVKEGSPLNAYFLPQGKTTTLAEEASDTVNPRAHAFLAMLRKDLLTCSPVMRHWAGAWQKNDG